MVLRNHVCSVNSGFQPTGISSHFWGFLLTARAPLVLQQVLFLGEFWLINHLFLKPTNRSQLGSGGGGGGTRALMELQKP